MTHPTPWLAHECIPDASLPFAVPVGIASLKYFRPEIHDLDFDYLPHRLLTYVWWETVAEQEYPDLPWVLHRHDVEALNDLDEEALLSLEGRGLSFVLRKNSPTVLGLVWSAQFLFEPIRIDDPFDANWEIPAVLRLIYADNTPLQAAYALDNPVGRLGFILWWIGEGVYKYPRVRWQLAPGVLQHWAQNDVASPHVGLPMFLTALLKLRPDLQQAFVGEDGEVDRTAFLTWWADRGVHEYPVSSVVLAAYLQTNPSLMASVEVTKVRLVGFAKSIMGLSEDIKSMSMALDQVGLPHFRIDAPLSGPVKNDASLECVDFKDRITPVTILCLPPPDLIRMGMEGGQSLLEQPSYKIGYWPWELSKWPDLYHSIVNMVDEVWAISAFVADAFRTITDKPVRVMPQTVTLGDYRAPRWALKKRKRFTVLSMFDANSWLSRKNPYAAVKAFQQAFQANEDVRLVIKTMKANASVPGWKAFSEEVAVDPRIEIINQTLSRAALLQLIDEADVFVSLHRSEGFGRILAEAMLLKTTVVASRYSGNLDFCNDQTAFMVSGTMRSVQPDEYLFHEGQEWFEPSLESAAEQLRAAWNDPALRAERLKHAHDLVVSNYSREAAGARYAQRIDEILEMTA